MLPELGLPREKFVFVSGIGCSSRFPYYMNTYGFHSIHGRAPAIATGLKIARPDLSVWVVTGDGDGLSIGGNHLIHALRRNMDLKILLFNNRIYGLTKGQYSPDLRDRQDDQVHARSGRSITPSTRSRSPWGWKPASSRGRSTSRRTSLQDILRRAYEHQGGAFIEIHQNCNIFNDGAWETVTDKATKADTVLLLEHGKPLIFGKNRDKGIRLGAGGSLEVVTLGNGTSETDVLVHDERNRSLAYMLAHLSNPTPIGVFHAMRPSRLRGGHGPAGGRRPAEAGGRGHQRPLQAGRDLGRGVTTIRVASTKDTRGGWGHSPSTDAGNLTDPSVTAGRMTSETRRRLLLPAVTSWAPMAWSPLPMSFACTSAMR